MIYIIAGQTASGKTKLALEFAKAVGGHIINGDAFQVYRKLDIGTAKPTVEEQSIVPHHLFDIVDINHPFSIYEYQSLVRAKIDELTTNQIPIVIVGGSGLYIRSVLFDYRFSDHIEVNMDAFSNKTPQELHAYLTQIDPKSAEKIHMNNVRRVLRAIEIYLQNGKAKSELEDEQDKRPYYQYLMVTLDKGRDYIEFKIEKRVRQMFEKGLKEELHELLKLYPKDSPGFKAIGYRELIENPMMDDEDLIRLISKNTRQYAKRQNTFFNNQFDVHKFNKDEQALQFLLNSFQGAKK